MFASKTREQAGFTPEPYRFYFSGKSMPASHIEGWDNSSSHVYFDPANQWHGVGTNPPNPILVAHRLTGGPVYYADLPEWPTFAQITHARKVLQRLARWRERFPGYCDVCMEPIDTQEDHVDLDPEDGTPVHAECLANWEGREA